MIASQDKLSATQDRYIQTIKEYCESEAKLHHNYFEALALQEEYEALAEAELLALETIIPFSKNDTKTGSPRANGANNPYRFMASASSGPNTPEKDAESLDSDEKKLNTI